MTRLLFTLLLLSFGAGAQASTLNQAMLTGVIDSISPKEEQVVLVAEGHKYRVARNTIPKNEYLFKGKITTAYLAFEVYENLKPLKN